LVEKISHEEFMQRTMGGRPCQLQMNIYQNCEFECGCGETHNYSSHTTEVLREIPMLKLVLQQSGCNYVTLIKIKGIFKYRFESLFSAING
tara:strand:- start:1 stop:273 length:273 start_codon:yes stop_codon:yes gene_type:complete